MRTASYFIIAATRKTIIVFAAVCSMLVIASTAQAVLIDFDDLVYIPSESEFNCWCDHPITNEYLSQGLLISDGYLAEHFGSSANSPSNYLIGGNSLQFSFVGNLPTSVGMYVSAFFEEAIYLTAVDASGQIIQKKTSGWAGPFDDTPYEPNQFISFTSPSGFTGVTVEGFYNMRTSAAIDNLTYEYSSVPEPSSFALLFVGLLGLGCLRLKTLGATEK